MGEALDIGDTKINMTEPFLLRGPEEKESHVTVVCRALLWSRCVYGLVMAQSRSQSVLCRSGEGDHGLLRARV